MSVSGLSLAMLRVLAITLMLGGCVTTAGQYHIADTMCELNGGLKEVNQAHYRPYFVCNNGARFEFTQLE